MLGCIQSAMRSPVAAAILLVGAAAILLAICPASVVEAKGSSSPIGVLPSNPYFFKDTRGKPLVLVGDYTWDTYSHLDFEYGKMFDSLKARGLNVARVWVFQGQGGGGRRGGQVMVPYLRTGPGNANDGRPKYDMDKFDPAFFDRLAAMCQAAKKRGINLQLILFDAWMLKHANLWAMHVYQRDNNINGVDGDPNNTTKGTDGKQGFCSANPAATKFTTGSTTAAQSSPNCVRCSSRPSALPTLSVRPWNH